MNEVVTNILGFIKVSRVPNLFIIAIVQIMTGLFLLSYPLSQLISVEFVILILTTQMVAAAGYIINDYYDQKIDMINRPDKVIVGITFKRRLALISHTMLNVIAIFLAYLIDPLIALIHLGSSALLWYYSNHLRRLPLLGNLAIASLGGMILLIVSIFFRISSQVVMIYALFAFLIILIREIIKDIEDVKGEAAYGCSTIPVIWGIRSTKNLIYLISFVGMALLTFFLMEIAQKEVRIFFVLLSPVFLWFLYQIHLADTQKHFKTVHNISNWIILCGVLSIAFING